MNNFSMCESHLGRWLETLSAYEFTLEHRPGILHSNTDALSRGRCIGDDCAHCERYEKKYNVVTPGVATRINGDGIQESTNMGESTEKEGLLRVLNIDVEGQLPTENGQWRSGCSEETPFPELRFVKEPVSTIHGGSKMVLLHK